MSRWDVEDFELPEGAEVSVYVPTDEEPEELTPEQEAEIEESIAELDRGEGIPAEEVLREVREILYRGRYRVLSDDEVEIVSIWHASRRPPRL